MHGYLNVTNGITWDAKRLLVSECAQDIQESRIINFMLCVVIEDADNLI